MTTTNRTPLSFDGFGVNDNDEYRTRLITFAHAVSEERRRELGPIFALAPEMADSLTDAEAAIGENLVWITDCADLLVRQKDPEALRRLKQLNDAWLSLVKITSRLPKGE